MKRRFLRVVSLFLTVIMLMGALPLSTLAAEINSPDTYTLSNGFIEVNVSKKNGGFDVRTVEGDKLNKDDNNKNLLFPLGENDTSFTSFRVTRGGETKDYIFGGKYSFLGLLDQGVTLTQDSTGITAVWGVDDLKFTQRIELANVGSNNHGMAYISYKAETTGAPADIKARILMDTALGYQDYAIYEMAGTDSSYTRVEKEGVYSNKDGNLYEKTFFAYDDIYNPTILAYTVNSTINEIECIPEKVAFGHWNNLAASVYDFTPDSEMTFTNPNNKKYLTADSAYALYFNMGTVTETASQSIATNYGVYSNDKVSGKNTVAVNLAAPPSMELAENKKEYVSKVQGGDPGDFTIQTSVENFKTDTSKVYDKVKIAVYCQTGIVPVSDDNILQDKSSYVNPYTKEVNDFKVDETKTIIWNLNAAVGAEASYRKVQFKVYNVSKDVDPTGSGQLLEENLLGESYCYILCPGGDGKLPEIKFTGSSPEIIYNEGNRHLFLTGTNYSMLENKSEYRVLARPMSGGGKDYIISSEQFYINADENTIDVLMTEKMNTGNYQLIIDYTDSGKKDIAAPAMMFTVSDDKAYRNDGYGVLAIVQSKGTSLGSSKYEIKTFGSESSYEKEKKNLGEVLIELKGEFVATDNVAGDGTILKYTGVSTGKGKNVMTLNNCIDVENGNLSVSINKYGTSNQSIDVDFDAELYTTGARTTIWKSGISALTSIENGKDYELIEYDNFGERSNNMQNKEPISLIWPSAAGVAQTVGGMIFEFRYGELGVIKDGGTEKRRVIAFGAMLDLSFLIPSNAAKSPADLDLYDKVNLAFFADSRYTTEYARHAWESHKEQVRAEEDADEGEGAVKVKDILFGGEYIGFNVNLKVQVPGYTPAMPTMAADLTINTIGDWAVAVDGMCKFTKFEMEASIDIKSKDGYPVPDKLYFFIKGFTPGVNVDGFGVLWLQGGGGGIENLYDTIFSTDSIPPLKLLISAQLSIMQVFSARADLALSLRGIGIKVSNGVIMDTDIKVLNHAQLQFEWYPEFYFMAAASLNIFEIITGGGYIVVESDGFFEFYVRAAIKIPDVVLFIGGIQLGSVDLGANSRRIWGGIEVIGIRAGVCYYWGGDFDFGFGGDAPQPSYPELLGKDDVPVYIDPETGRVLYMHVGTNFELAADTELVENMSESTVLMGGDTGIKSQAEKKKHELTLGDKGEKDAILSMNFSAETKEEAIEIANKITIIDNGGNPYEIEIYNSNFAADAVENKGTNANLTYNSETKKAGFNVTFTEDSVYKKVWNISTPDAATDLLLYNVLPMASLKNVSASINGNEITANWDGKDLGKFETMSFMAVKEPDDTEGSLIYKIDNTIIASKTVSFTLPDNLESGSYYIKATAVKDGELCETAVTPGSFDFTNTNLPPHPTSVAAVNGGDYKIDANIAGPEETYDGYLINIYEKEDTSWVLNEAGGIEYEKGTEKMSVGGSYSYTDGDTTVTKGLKPGKVYKLGVKSYRKDSSDPTKEKVFYSNEAYSNEITLLEPNTPNVKLTGENAKAIEYSSGEAETILIDTFNKEDVKLIMNSDQKVSGTWTLNKGYVLTDDDGTQDTTGMTGTISNSESSGIAFNGLEDGNHILTFIGKSNAGDGVIVQKRFAVDTLPPRLLLESPVNGGLFEADGKFEVKGITDAGTKIIVNGKEYYPDVNLDGSFAVEAKLDESKASLSVTITAVDEIGNETSQSMTVTNKALGQIKELILYADGLNVTNESLTGGKDLVSSTTKNLVLKAKVSDSDREIILNDSSLVSWDTIAVAGSSSVNDDSTLLLGAGARGIVSGKLAVSEDGGLTAAAVFGEQDYGDSKEDYYSITVVEPSVGGSISVSQITAKEGTPITVTSTPAEGYTLKNIKINNVLIQSKTFIMPANNVTVTAEFESAAISDGGGGGGGTSITGLYISTSLTGNGMITPSGTIKAEKNSSMTFNITPDKGYKIIDVLVDGKSVGVVLQYTFEDIQESHTIKAIFAKAESEFDRFTDVRGHWAEKYMRAMVERGLFMGVGEVVFAPEHAMTRGMFVTVMGRLEKVDTGLKTNKYNDIPEHMYYAPYVAWATEQGIVKGIEETMFMPDRLITREQLSAILYRYAQYKGYDLSSEEDINLQSYEDYREISEYAVPAVQWCVEAGIIQGSNDGKLHPGNIATRAEVSAILLRFIDKYIK